MRVARGVELPKLFTGGLPGEFRKIHDRDWDRCVKYELLRRSRSGRYAAAAGLSHKHG